MIWAIIMAGGKGTRFWPKSRLRSPKQLESIVSERTMIEETVKRLSPVIPPRRIVVVTHRDQVKAARRRLPQIPANQFIAEPVGKNTAPCALVASLWIRKRDPRAITAVLPADHVIHNKREFHKNLKLAARAADNFGAHITFGIRPKFPNTGYGYIERGRRVEKKKGISIFKVRRFVEKPNLKRAKQYVKSRRYYWNSGMFVWSVGTIVESFRKYLPQVFKALNGYENVISAFLRNRFLERAYQKIPSISLDYGIMERARGVYVLQVTFDWSDVGSWRELYDFWPKDKSKNAYRGKIATIGSKGNILFASKRLIATVGVNDTIIVETGDALLVCPKNRAQDIKRLVEFLGKKKMREYL